MNDPRLGTVTLDSKSLDGAIEVLASAAASFRLTRRERIGYWALMASVDIALVTFIVAMVLTVVGALLVTKDDSTVGSVAFESFIGVATIPFVVAFLVGVISFLLNLPLIRRTMQERSRLNKLGVTALSKSLLKASRRHYLLRRVRDKLSMALAALFAVSAVVVPLAMSFVGSTKSSDPDLTGLLIGLAVFYGVFAVMLIGARHLRNQLEEMDLSGNAVELRKALQSLRQAIRATGTIAVPTELIEQAAKIESAQIAKDRKSAILRSADPHSRGYAITFADKAAEQRAALAVADRLELEDLLVYLSTADDTPETQSTTLRHDGTGTRLTTPNKRVQVEYVIDQKSRGIRVTAVHQLTKNEMGHMVAGANGG